MIQSSASYAGVTYFLDSFVGGGRSNKGVITQEKEDEEFAFTDVPVQD